MDTRDGTILTPEEYASILRRFPENDYLTRFYKPMEVAPTEKQLARKPPKIGRNELCPCGSGKKFKKCCLESVI